MSKSALDNQVVSATLTKPSSVGKSLTHHTKSPLKFSLFEAKRDEALNEDELLLNKKLKKSNFDADAEYQTGYIVSATTENHLSAPGQTTDKQSNDDDKAGGWFSRNGLYLLGGVALLGGAAAAGGGGGGGSSTPTGDAVTQPKVTLSTDTGSSATDLNTNNAGLTLSALGNGVTRSYSVDGGAASVSYTAPTSNGQHSVVVTDTDVTGKSLSTTIQFTLDKEIITPTISLGNDTGTLSTDKITSDATLNISAAASDVTRTYSVDGSAASTTYTRPTTRKAHTVVVTDTDTAGNIATATLDFTLYPELTSPTLSFSNSSRLLNSNPVFEPTGVTRVYTIYDAAGTVVKTNVDEFWFGSNSSFDPKPTTVGHYSISFTDSDIAGNTVTSNPLHFYVGNADAQTITDATTPNYLFYLGSGDDNISGMGSNYIIYTEAGNDLVTLNQSNVADVLGIQGSGLIDGGAGFDTLIIDGANATLDLSLVDLQGIEEIRAINGAQLTIRELTPSDVKSIADTGQVSALNYFTDNASLLNSTYDQLILDSYSEIPVNINYYAGQWNKVGEVTDEFGGIYSVWNSLEATVSNVQLIMASSITP